MGHHHLSPPADSRADWLQEEDLKVCWELAQASSSSIEAQLHSFEVVSHGLVEAEVVVPLWVWAGLLKRVLLVSTGWTTREVR